MRFITSDLHFNHEAILRFCKETRPFQTIQDMNAAIIKEWNSKVRPQDEIYHLGDFMFGKFDNVYKETCRVLEQLQGKKIFIKGNHDTSQTVKAFKEFGEVYDYLEIKHEKQFIIMSHYPLACWNKARYNSLHAFGHCHGSFKGIGKSVDVGYDAQGKILTLEEFVEQATAKDKEILDGH